MRPPRSSSRRRLLGLLAAGAAGASFGVRGAESRFTIARTGRGYPSCQAAIDAAQDGDRIVCAPGTYRDFYVYVKKALTFAAADPSDRPVFVGKPAGDMFEWEWVPARGAIGLENLVLAHNLSEGSNAAGIHTNGRDYTLTVRGCKFERLNNGLLIGQHAGAQLVLENSEFYNCGNGTDSPATHAFYIGGVESLDVIGCWSHGDDGRDDQKVWEVPIGHMLKSRARRTTVLASRFANQGGRYSCCLEFPNGGDVLVAGCELEESPLSDSPYDIVRYGMEGYAADGRTNRLRMYQNTVVNHGRPSEALLVVREQRGERPALDVRDNVFAGANDGFRVKDLQPQRGVVEIERLQFVGNSQVPLEALRDHRGGQWGLVQPVPGARAWTDAAYVHPARHGPRTDAFRGAVPVRARTG